MALSGDGGANRVSNVADGGVLGLVQYSVNLSDNIFKERRQDAETSSPEEVLCFWHQHAAA